MFSDTIGYDCEKNIKLSCKYSSEDHEIEFTKTTIESCEEELELFYDSTDEKAQIHEVTAVDCIWNYLSVAEHCEKTLNLLRWYGFVNYVLQKRDLK